MKRFVALTAFVAFGVLTCGPPPSADLDAQIRQAALAAAAPITMKDATRVDFERAVVFAPCESVAVIDRALGFDWPLARELERGDSCADSNHLRYLAVLVAGNNVVAWDVLNDGSAAQELILDARWGAPLVISPGARFRALITNDAITLELVK